ncbi:cytochrome P450 [Granulosicoccus sp. 3-233]|uniref:cytochrome P450 n=1 Tax=Granulosicoccus sp. 3-233 TaxID=3417969 RepID=UPI003D343103
MQNPYCLYRRLHQMGGPIYWQDYGFWCLADFSTVNRTLRDRRFARLPPAGCELPGLPAHLADFAAVEKHSLLALEPPDHTRLRQRINRSFVSRQVERMAPAIRARAHERIDRLVQARHAELLSQYATPIPVTVITQLLGVPESAGNRLVEWSHAMVKVYTMTQTQAEEHAANAAACEFRDFLIPIITAKRRAPGEDLLSQLVRDDGEGQSLSDDEVVSTAILLLNAGHEATVHQLGNAVKTLLEHYPPGPARQELLTLLADSRSADALVNECLRFDAPLHLFMRYAQETIELEQGPTLQAGEPVGLLLAAANHCPQRFAEPQSFRPLRDDAGQLSLGAGIHFCVGAPLAKLELRIALQVLFERLPELTANGEWQYLDAYHFHGLQQLPVRW